MSLLGTELPERQYTVTRADLVRYAGASGDFNPIHWSDRSARSLGLPGVIAHGMYTMALAARAVADWAGGPDAISEYSVKFAAPVPVPDDDTGTTLTVTGKVAKELGDGLVQVDLTVTLDGEKVLNRARAVVRPPA